MNNYFINIDWGESLSQLEILNLDLSQWKERPLCLLLFDSLTCYLVIAYGNFEHNKNILNIRGGLIWGKAYLEVIWYSQPNVDPMFLQFKRWPNFIFFWIIKRFPGVNLAPDSRPRNYSGDGPDWGRESGPVSGAGIRGGKKR